MGMVILKLLVLPVLLPSFCHARATGTVGNIFPANDSRFQNEDKAACMWAGLCIMVNNTFAAVGAVSTRALSRAKDVLRTVEVILESPPSVLNETIRSRAEEAKGSANKGKDDIDRTLEAVKKARGEGCGSLLTANSEFEGSKRKKGEILKLLVNNFTLCKGNYSRNIVTVAEAEKYIEGNISNLSRWANDTKKKWSNVSSGTWEAIEASGRNNVKESWNSVWKSLHSFLDSVSVRLMSAELDLKEGMKVAGEAASLRSERVAVVTRGLKREGQNLCSAEAQLRSIVQSLRGTREVELQNIGIAYSRADKVRESDQQIKGYRDALMQVAPQHANVTLSHQLSGGVDAGKHYTKNVSISIGKVRGSVKDIHAMIGEMNGTITSMLGALQKLMFYLNEENRRVSGNDSAQLQECSATEDDVTRGSLPWTGKPFPDLDSSLGDADTFAKNWTAITSNFTAVQQAIASIEESVKETEGALSGIENVRKNVATVVTSELESVRTSLCEARRKLGSATAYHVSMNQRFMEADEGVGEVQKKTAAVQELVKQVRRDVESYRHAEKTAAGAVGEAKQTCLNAEESAAERDGEAKLAANEACEASKRVAFERERVVDERHKMEEAARSAVSYGADALRVSLNADTAKKTAVEARANIEKLLKRVDAQIKEVEKRFNGTVASLKNLSSLHVPTACASTGTTAPSDPMEDLAGAVVNFRRLVAETADTNFSIIASTLRSSGKWARDELEGVRKAVEDAKSMLVRATAIRELSRAQIRTTRAALLRAKKALREAQDAADRAASGCMPLYKQVLRIFTHLS